MKKLLVLAVFLLSAKMALATAVIQPIADTAISDTFVRLRYANTAGTDYFQFQIWDKRENHIEYRKVQTVTKNHRHKNKTWAKIKITDLKPDRDYEVRYRSVYGGTNHLGSWSDFVLFHTKVQGVYFTVTVPADTASTDTVCITLDNSSTTTVVPGAYCLDQIDTTTWYGAIADVAVGDVIKYSVSRNDDQPRDFEQFTPDDPTQLRSVTVQALPEDHAITVATWRWYDTTPPTGTVSSDAWPITVRSQFVLSSNLSEVYGPGFDPLVDSTMSAVATTGWHYVTIHYAPRMINAADPDITSTKTVIDSPTKDQVETEIASAQAAGLTPILAIDFPIDPTHVNSITNAINSGDHGNHYFSNYLTRWREAMNDGIDVAVAQNISIVVLDTSFQEFTYASNTQQAYVSYVLEHDIMPVVRSGYDGILTSEDVSSDPDFTWYEAPELDWLGDTWYPDLTDSITPSVADMTTSAQTQLATTYQTLHLTYGKPIFFNRLGVMSWDGAAAAGEAVSPDSTHVSPDSADDPAYVIDNQEQADAYEALFRAIAGADYVIGASTVEYSYDIRHDKSADVRDKLAEQVWGRWIALFDAAI